MFILAKIGKHENAKITKEGEKNTLKSETIPITEEKHFWTSGSNHNVYPPMITAMANGICSPDTKLITGGFDTDPSIIDNVGNSEGKVIISISFSPAEDSAYSMILQ